MVLPQQLMNSYKENLSFFICPVPSIDQKVLCRFIREGYFERHLNRMRNIYRKKREAFVNAIYESNCDMEIIGADAGLHLLLRVNNGMTEDQLVSEALKAGVKVYKLSKYFIDFEGMDLKPALVLGYATLSEAEITKAVQNESESVIQINQGVEQISGTVQTNSATAEETAAASEELAVQARLLQEIVNKYKV
jgi:GntR family transcriptional regulator/MocR family aminotransferase